MGSGPGAGRTPPAAARRSAKVLNRRSKLVFCRRRLKRRRDDYRILLERTTTMRPVWGWLLGSLLALLSQGVLADPVGYAAGFSDLYRIDFGTGQASLV